MPVVESHRHVLPPLTFARMVIVCFGTRPEIIKLAPVISALQAQGVPFCTVFTGQHPDLYRDVSALIPPPDFHAVFDAPAVSLSDSLARTLRWLDELFTREKPRLVVAQGDTSTVLATAMAAFYRQIPFGHVEAGLRTYDLSQPFPEEAIRQQVSRLATLHWAPTQRAADNLEREGILNRVEITGNTIVDICQSFDLQAEYGNQVLVTLHRRENHGEAFERLAAQLQQLAGAHPELDFVFPMHPNPAVQRLKDRLGKLRVVDPLPYPELLKVLSQARFVISDSGGIQEECGVFGKKILVCRQFTERPEGVEAGFARLVGDDLLRHFNWANDTPQWSGANPYGDGQASSRIVGSIRRFLDLG